MTKVSVAHWWAYIVFGLVLLGSWVPAMISYADTFIVLLGLLLLAGYGVWSWLLWIRPVVKIYQNAHRVK